jgi:hypothetical protein
MDKKKVTDVKLQEVNKNLYEVSEKQVKNQRDIITNEQSEQDFEEVSRKYRRVYDRLFCSWNKDKEFANWLNQENTELLHYNRKVTINLENQREELLRERKYLNELENDLYEQKRSLLREVK